MNTCWVDIYFAIRLAIPICQKTLSSIIRVASLPINFRVPKNPNKYLTRCSHSNRWNVSIYVTHNFNRIEPTLTLRLIITLYCIVSCCVHSIRFLVLFTLKTKIWKPNQSWKKSPKALVLSPLFDICFFQRLATHFQIPRQKYNREPQKIKFNNIVKTFLKHRTCKIYNILTMNGSYLMQLLYGQCSLFNIHAVHWIFNLHFGWPWFKMCFELKRKLYKQPNILHAAIFCFVYCIQGENHKKVVPELLTI